MNKKRVLGLFGIFFFVFLFSGTFDFAVLRKNSQATKAEDRLRAWEKQNKMRQSSPFKNMKWRPVGPKFQGGRIETIASHAGNSATIYLGFGAGNIWKTENHGTTWEPVFEQESTFAIGDIEVAKSDPDIVWAGTGENLMARSSFAGSGVFKSEDGGLTWKNMGLPESHHIGRIVIDPEDPGIVYVAALGHQYTFNKERGLYKTIDGGLTWEKSLYISEKVGVVDVVIDPSDNRILYAVAWERDRKAWNNLINGEGSAVYKTTDAGLTWSKLTSGLPTGKYIGRIGLAAAPSAPATIYAVVDNQTPIKSKGRDRKIGGEVYRSDDRGETWHKTHSSALFAEVNYSFGDIRVSPEDENRVYVLGVNLMSSENGGRTFHRIKGTVVHLYHHSTRALHLDQHDLWIDPKDPKRLLLGNDGGLFISRDRGKNWLHVNNIPTAEFYAISLDMADPYNIYGGTQDNSALFGPGNQEIEDGIRDPWQHIWIDLWGGGDSYYTLADPETPGIIYYEQQFGPLKRKNMHAGTTKYIQPKAKKGEPDLRYNWMTPFLISHYNSSTLYYGANKLFKSRDKGDNWTCISPDLSTRPGPEKQGNVPYGAITTLSESPLQPGLLYAGTDDGNVYVTRDGGAEWTMIKNGLPAKWVSRIVASAFDEGTVFVSLTGYRDDDFSTYVFQSDDFGSNWKSITANLPAESVNVIREDPGNKNMLYLGTDHGGVYVSIDRGKSWYSLCNDLPMTPVHDIALHPRDRELVIGTHGRSAFVLDIAPLQDFSNEVMEKKAHLFPVRPALIPQSRDYQGDWALETRKKARIYYYLKESQVINIEILDSEGKAVKQLTGSQDAGINLVEWDLSLDTQAADKSVYTRGSSLAKPGDYKVRIGVDAQVLEGKIRVDRPQPAKLGYLK